MISSVLCVVQVLIKRVNYFMRSILFCLVFLPSLVFAQESENMIFLSQVDLPNLPTQLGAQYGDVWGYTYPNGAEVAIIALIEQILFVDISSPANPVIVLDYPVVNAGTTTPNHSLWRDFDTYEHYIYAVSDQQTAGLIVFDMGSLPTSISAVFQSSAVFSRSHTLFIDQENGKLYAAGSNTQSNGLKILDIATDPENPTLFASVPLVGYVHDVYVRDDTAYCSHGSLSKINIYDFNALPTSYTLLGTIENYPEAGYNHSSWLNEGENKIVFCDETFGSDVKIVNIDMQNLGDISADDIHTFYSELLGAAVPGSSVGHNPYIIGDLVYISYYEDGVQVFDISDPANVTRFAYYDTYPDNVQYNGYIGCWGVYPFFPSGTIVASDMNNGLIMMQIENGALDIDFISFAAVRQKEDVMLTWTIADVSDGNTFDVLRSSDGGITYNSIGKVALTDNQSQYSFLDKNVPVQQTLRYRIDFVQLDGRLLHSPVRSITSQTPRLEKNIRVVNPMTTSLTLDILNPIESLDINIFDVDGRLVWTHEESHPMARMEMPLNGIVPGHYLMNLSWPGGTQSLLIQVIE